MHVDAVGGEAEVCRDAEGDEVFTAVYKAFDEVLWGEAKELVV